MQTIKININLTEADNDFVINKQKNYSHAFRRLYKHFDKITNVDYLNSLKKTYGLSDYEKNCLKIDVTTKINQVQAQKKKLEADIVELTDFIDEQRSKKKLTKRETRKLFKSINKLEYKNSRLCKDITFGGLKNLKRLSFLCNDKVNNTLEISEARNIYLKQRILPINYIGSSCDPNSNRYFIFDFENNVITYKPNKGKKIVINYVISNGYKKILKRLQLIKDQKFMPISVKLSHDYINISFDEQLLNGFAFNEKDYLIERNKINKDDIELRKSVFIKHKTEQNNRMLVGKNINRYCSIDLNPEYIGVSVLDKINDLGEFRIVKTYCYDLSELLKKNNKNSSDKDSIYVGNKRKFEIGCVYKKIFQLCEYYGVSHFVIEDLNFKPKAKDKEAAKEANRKTKNVWNLNYQKNLITKHCNTKGIELIEVNPIYTSFIGNLMYNYFDPTNASIEIGRRGIFKYTKGWFYPELTDVIIDTVVERFKAFPDVQMIKGQRVWGNLYKLIKETGVKYRWQLSEVDYCFSINHIKSKWKLITFGKVI